MLHLLLHQLVFRCQKRVRAFRYLTYFRLALLHKFLKVQLEVGLSLLVVATRGGRKEILQALRLHLFKLSQSGLGLREVHLDLVLLYRPLGQLKRFIVLYVR